MDDKETSPSLSTDWYNRVSFRVCSHFMLLLHLLCTVQLFYWNKVPTTSHQAPFFRKTLTCLQLLGATFLSKGWDFSAGRPSLNMDPTHWPVFSPESNCHFSALLFPGATPPSPTDGPGPYRGACSISGGSYCAMC